MFIKYSLVIFIGCLSSLIHADDITASDATVGITYGAIQNPNHVKMLQVKFNSYEYKMNQNQFKQLLKNSNLQKSSLSLNSKNIVYNDQINTTELEQIKHQIEKIASSVDSGNITCAINNKNCQTLSTEKINNNKITIVKQFTFKPFSHLKQLNTQFSGSYKIITSDIGKAKHERILLNFDTLFTNIISKNYIIISQISKKGILHGQIILISFN